MQILGLSLMSLAMLMYGIIPLFADLNRTHAANPQWPKHARFHVVSQVLTTSAVAAISLWLLWSSKLERDLGICLATILSFAVIGGFFASAALLRFYGGALSDDEGGISKLGKVNLNAINFGAAALLLVIGRIVLL